MKKRSGTVSKKAGKKKRKPIMRHSREGVKARKPKRSTMTKRTKGRAKPRAAAKTARRRTRPSGTAGKKPSKSPRLRRGTTESGLEPLLYARGMGADSAGQSGDTEALSRAEDVDSESVEELLEEGQAFEAGVIGGVEEADDGPGEVRTRQVPVDDVPKEYLDED
jgi:hypothetical protein